MAMLSLAPFSLVKAESDYVAYSKKGFDECFDKTLSGKKIVVPCEQPSPVMTPAEIQESIDQFRSFENGDIVEAVFEAARQRDTLPKAESPFGQKIKPKESVNSHSKEQSSNRNDNFQKYLQFRSQFKPEVAQKMGGVKNERYLVTLAFSNDGDFPKKHSSGEVFIGNDSEAYASDWKSIIFKHYLGDDYNRYQPVLGAVHEVAVIQVLVDVSKDLAKIVENQPVESISHIGGPEGSLDESSHLPLKTKR
ncbi:hypothetical protein [Arenicella xantha]|uniref:hypothetical protein n=1 Tax=Arenicella xantha TaxID=644221 RepID=UPI0011BE5B99|nr:hypothetical protein [Arenicella xantha]